VFFKGYVLSRMSVKDEWQTLNEFQSMVNPTGDQIMGSVRYPRYQNSYPGRSPQEELSILQDHYRERCRDLSKLKRLIEEKQRAIERACAHKWQYDETSRDHRSRYVCMICGTDR